MFSDYSLSVVLPVYNEESNIKKVIREIVDFLQSQHLFKNYEVIAVDDGSKDKTSSVLARLTASISYLKVVTHRKNLGYGQTLISGAKKAKGGYIFFMDADGQFKIRDIEKLCFYIKDYDVIVGYRNKRKDPFYRYFLGRWYTRLIFLLFGLRFKDVNCGFKLCKKEVLELAQIKCKGAGFYAEILDRAKKTGCKIKEVPVNHFPRLKGKQTGANMEVILRTFLDLVRLKFFKLVI